MKTIIKILLVLVVLGLAALSGFAYFGDMAPEQNVVTQPVILNGE
ncbi:MAG: hypothetical protein ACK5M4_14515 [Pseudorhodobacter sp.]